VDASDADRDERAANQLLHDGARQSPELLSPTPIFVQFFFVGGPFQRTNKAFKGNYIYVHNRIAIFFPRKPYALAGFEPFR
jgi:hypothetical protein